MQEKIKEAVATSRSKMAKSGMHFDLIKNANGDLSQVDKDQISPEHVDEAQGLLKDLMKNAGNLVNELS